MGDFQPPPLNPLYLDQFFMLLNPDQGTSSVDMDFFNRYHHELLPEWLLMDPCGNTHLVLFNPMLTFPTVTAGWSSLMSYYGIDKTHWVALKYIGQSLFDIQIFDELLVEIVYPVPLPPVEPFFPHLQNLNIMDFDLNLPPPELMLDVFPANAPIVPYVNQVPPPAYHMAHTTILTDNKAYFSQLGLPLYVARYIREWGPHPWTLRGPTGMTQTVCVVAPPGEYYARLGGGWESFCDMHAIIAGDIVTLSFTDGVQRIIDVNVIESGVM